jgi:hypothetical protein
MHSFFESTGAAPGIRRRYEFTKINRHRPLEMATTPLSPLCFP